MINEIRIDLLADYVQLQFDLLPEKDVLFKNSIINKAPSDLAVAKESGERVRIPLFELDGGGWENILTPPVTAGTVASTPNNATTYTANGLTMRDEYAIKAWRRKLFEWSRANDFLRTKGYTDQAYIEIARQLFRDAMRTIDDDMHRVLQGAIPAANEYDETVNNFLTRDVTKRYLDPRIINQASGEIGDNMGLLDILIVHSKVWRNLKDSAYATYANATLLEPTNLQPESKNLWLADGKIVYVTDKCKNDVGETGEVTYESYLLAPNTLELMIHEDYHIVLDAQSALMETQYARGNIGYTPHLKGMEYLLTAPVKPTSAQIGSASNWQLGRYSDAKEVTAVRIITN